MTIPLPAGAYDENKALLAVSGGIAVDATAEIALDGVAEFLANHSSWQIKLLSCEAGHADTLKTLATKVNESLTDGRVRVENGTSLVYSSLKGSVIFIK